MTSGETPGEPSSRVSGGAASSPCLGLPSTPPTAAHPTHEQCPYRPTSPSPGPATHPVLVGIDRGIANSPPKPGHIPRLQRGGHHQECHPLPLTVISTLLTKPPQPTGALKAPPSAPDPAPAPDHLGQEHPKPASCPCSSVLAGSGQTPPGVEWPALRPAGRGNGLRVGSALSDAEARPVEAASGTAGEGFPDPGVGRGRQGSGERRYSQAGRPLWCWYTAGPARNPTCSTFGRWRAACPWRSLTAGRQQL